MEQQNRKGPEQSEPHRYLAQINRYHNKADCVTSAPYLFHTCLTPCFGFLLSHRNSLAYLSLIKLLSIFSASHLGTTVLVTIIFPDSKHQNKNILNPFKYQKNFLRTLYPKQVTTECSLRYCNIIWPLNRLRKKPYMSTS